MSNIDEIKKKYLEAKRIINEAMKDDQLVLFVGAGTSICAGMPTWREAISLIAERMGINTTDINSDDFLKIPQYYYNSRGKKEYTQLMQSVFRDSQYIPKQHVHDLIIRFNTKTIITTNYDNLIERAAEDNSEMIHVVSKDIDLPYKKGGRKLIKMHGDFKNDNFVLKEDDYLNYSKNFGLIENYIKSIIGTKVVLFIGYSFNDPDTKHIFSWVKDILGDNFQPAYMIETGGSYDINMDEYYRNFGINLLYASVQIEEFSENQTINLEKMLKWLLDKDYSSRLDSLYDDIRVFDGLEYAYTDYVESILNRYGFTVQYGYICNKILPQSPRKTDEWTDKIIEDLLYIASQKKGVDIYVQEKNEKGKQLYKYIYHRKIGTDEYKKLESIYNILNKSGFDGLKIYQLIDEEHPLLNGENDFFGYHGIITDFRNAETPEWIEAVKTFDEGKLKEKVDENNKRLNDGSPDLYMEQAAIYTYLGNYLAAYNCLKNASKKYYKTNEAVKYYISETDRFYIGRMIKNNGVYFGIKAEDVSRVTKEIDFMDMEVIYRGISDVGSGWIILKEISDFKLSLSVFQKAYGISQKVKEQSSTEYSLFAGLPAFFNMRENVKNYYLFTTFNYIILDGYNENMQIYRLYFQSILDSVLAPELKNGSDSEKEYNNIHADSLSEFDLYLALRYEDISELRKLLKQVGIIPINDNAYEYLKKVIECSSMPGISFNPNPIRPFWKVILLLGHIELRKDLFETALYKLLEYTDEHNYVEHHQSLLRFFDNAETQGLIDNSNIGDVYNYLSSTLRYLIDKQRAESIYINRLTNLLAYICFVHNKAYDETETIKELLHKNLEKLCIEIYPHLGDNAKLIINEQYISWSQHENTFAEYELYCLLVESEIVDANKQIEVNMLEYCAREKKKREITDNNAVNNGIRIISIPNNNSEEQLLIMMCNLFLKDKIVDKNEFRKKIADIGYDLVCWLTSLDEFDYSIFKLEWLDGCSPSLLEMICSNEKARSNIAEIFVDNYNRGVLRKRQEDLYFKFFAVANKF